MKKTALAISILLIAVVETGCYTTDDIVPPYAQSMDTQQSSNTARTERGSYQDSDAAVPSGPHRTWVNGHSEGGTWVRGHFEG